MLLTPTEFRAFKETSLTDPSLMTLLDAAEQTINDAIGPVGAVTEWISSGSGDLIALGRSASAVTAINERDVDLDPTDYELSSTGRFLRRLDTGVNVQSRWLGRVIVTYTAADDLARRKAAQVALVELELDRQEGGSTQSERIGDWSETFADAQEAQAKRSEILTSLSGNALVIL